MKRLASALLFLLTGLCYSQGLGVSQSAANPATILCRYDNLNLSADGWSFCGDSACAGGLGHGTALTIVPGSPMTLSYNSPAAFNNALFIVKPGVCDNATWIRFEFDVVTPAGLNQKEFDDFSFILTPARIDIMLGKQCNFATAGFWQYATNFGGWNNSAIVCNTSTISDGVSHHLIFSSSWNPNDTSCGGFPTSHLGTITVDGTTYNWNATQCAEALPSGWTHTIGGQFQMNSNVSATLTETVNNVSLWAGK